jgi:glutamate N-acetyltransferase / amino-acid N-acetyltransferase
MSYKDLKKFPKLPTFTGMSIIYDSVGIKSKSRLDLSLVIFDGYANVASIMTKSKTCGANIKWLKKIKNHGKVKVLFVNSGNANAYTGKEGYLNVKKIVNYFYENKLCNKSEVIISSTGVIGEQLPIKKIITSLPNILKKPIIKKTKENDWKSFAKSILTTDTFPKASYTVSKIGNKKVKILGVSKGSGMIAPNMATMLGYIFTDADLSPVILKGLLTRVSEKTFNSITVDSDTSTSDMVCFFSTRKVKCNIGNYSDKKLEKFKDDLEKVALDLAKKIVFDGEGASKLVEIKVTGGKSYKASKKIALSIANSPLVKTAIAGEDANWGRIIMAIGKTNETVEQDKISLGFGNIMIIRAGEIVKGYKENRLAKYLKEKELQINIDLGMGGAVSKVWTCDLTKEYISINADYRS